MQHRFSAAHCLVAVQIVTCLSFLSAHGSAMAQWVWLDANGNKVFSDIAPPLGTPDKNIVKRPGAPVAKPVSAEIGKSPSTDAPNSATKPPAVKNDLEAKKKQAEDAEKAKQKADDEKLAKAKADNCQRARQGKAAFDSGVRLSTTNAKGERVFMDEKARASEQQRLQQIIQSDCAR